MDKAALIRLPVAWGCSGQSNPWTPHDIPLLTLPLACWLLANTGSLAHAYSKTPMLS